MAHIKTYCRIKPTRSTFKDYQNATNVLHIQVPESSGLNPRQQRPSVNHDFKYSYIFNDQANQEVVFDKVCKEIIEGFLAGYNGTIFAYGQTGTGKTYTMEGSARRYKDRGLSPRAISLIYKSLERRQDEELDVHISYMEIYQEVGYDLLNPATRLGAVVTSFPKVSVLEGANGASAMRNLSQHLAAKEEVAQGLLIEGQSNRQVAETPMNKRSSRSHAVFTIQLSVKKPNEDVITRSKLHLVDLAGSERVSKTGIEGQQLTEAKYINLSLHYLEGVIVALQQEASSTRPQLPTPNFTQYNSEPPVGRCQSAPCLRTQPGWVNSLRPSSASVGNPLGQTSQHNRHIPYRNSLLTMVLRDSLGGNCQTAMIATITFEEENLGETLSTCRFAQRVACITNVVSKNQELDDKSLIRRLRKRVAELESQVALLREGLDLPELADGFGNKLTDEEKLECARIMQNYLTGRTKDPITAGITTPSRFRECLRLLKKLILEHYSREGNDNHPRVILDGRTQKSIAAPPQQTAPGQFRAVSSSNSPTSKLSADHHGATSLTTTSPGQKTSPPNRSAFRSTERDNKILHDGGQTPDPGSKRPASAQVQGQRDRMARQQGSERSDVTRERSRPDRSRSPLKPQLTQESRPQPAPRPSREAYKSPFDQQREQQVQKLDQKVVKEQLSLSDERTQLDHQQAKIKIAQLNLLKNDLGSKLSVTQEQLKEQKLYILQLQNTPTDKDFIEQEKIVAKQLRKREIRVERRLQLVNEQLDQLQARQINASDPIPKPRPLRPKHNPKQESTRTTTATPWQHSASASHNPSIQNHQTATHPADNQTQPASTKAHPAHVPISKVAPPDGEMENRYPQYVKRDGTMNTRQVLDALKAQDKQQEKVRTDLEKEKIYTMSQQIQNKEAATRQKLLEFKEKLKQAKLGSFQSRKRDSSPEQTGSGGEQSKPPIPSRRSAFAEPQPTPRRHNIATTAVPSNTAQVEKPTNEQKSSNLSSASTTSLAMMIPKGSDVVSRTNSNTTLQAGDAGLDSRNGSFRGAQTLSFLPPSRVSSASSKTAHELADDLLYLEKRRNISAMWGRESVATNTAANTPAVPMFVGGDISRLSAGNIRSTPIKDLGYEDTPRVNSIDNSIYRASSNASFDIGRSVSETSICDAEIQKVFQQNGGQDSGLHSGSSSPFNPHDNESQKTSPEPAKPQPNVVKPQYTQPHRLANQFMSENDKHKITEDSEKKFSQKKFDDTLQMMLGTDTQPMLNYSQDHYNKFARPGRDRCKSAKVTSEKSRPKPTTQGVRSHMTRPSETAESSSGDNAKTFNPWGPEAKGMSVGERIAKYLEVSSKDQNTGHSDDDVDISDHHVTAASQPKAKVKALEDTAREETYMSSMRAERLRVARIRKARSAAEVIQKSWRNYKQRRR